MKVRHGANQDFADFDEIDPDIEDVIREFDAGVVSYQELVALVGADQALTMLLERGDDVSFLLDDPEYL